MQAPMVSRLDLRTREQATYESLRRAITEGRWGPDNPIVGSRIAGDLGVSRITVYNYLNAIHR